MSSTAPLTSRPLVRSVLISTSLATLLTSVLFIVGNHLAHAILGGPVQSSFAFSGTLTGTTGAQTLTFKFRRGALMCDVMVPGVMPEPGTGAFSVAVPIGTCPAALLDDPETTVAVAVGAVDVVLASPIQPVPFARYAEHLGTALCPVGYDPGMSGSVAICTRGFDVMVRVGSGPSAFWIDRYEASAWESPDGAGRQFGAATDDYPPSFPDNGQWTTTTPPVYAASKVGVRPSGSLTWFQAIAACRASGKRLPTRDEWLGAARGTADRATDCNVMTSPARATSAAGACQSAWGVQDMIGNVWEWTDEWYASPNNSATDFNATWPAGYSSDGTYGVTNYVYVGGGPRQQGLPAAALRGGDSTTGVRSGVFALDLNESPSVWLPNFGFRCVSER